MITKDYIPTRDGDLSVWASNIVTVLPGSAGKLGLTSEQATETVAAAQTIITAISQNNTAQDAAQAATALKKQKVADAVAALRATFKRGKTAPDYTAEVGEALKIIGTDEPVDWAMFTPELTAQTFPGHVTLKFKKGGAQGVNIYTRLENIGGWVKLAFDSSSPYVDNRPVPAGAPPENRQYMCIAVLHDAEVSQQSAVVSVAFAG